MKEVAQISPKHRNQKASYAVENVALRLWRAKNFPIIKGTVDLGLAFSAHGANFLSHLENIS